MVKHIILWKIDERYTAEEKQEIMQNIKTNLEGLGGKINGLLEIKVNIERLPSSTVDLMLDSTFENEESLKNYSVNPLHVAVADGFVRPYTAIRSCFDFEI